MRNRNSILPLLALGLVLWTLAGCATPAPASPTPTAVTAADDTPRPSNPGGPGPALGMKGDSASGAQIFATHCVPCHADQGKGGVANPGSTDGTVPPLNPIDPGLANKDPKVFAYNIDLFIEHGSTPDGPNPALKMVPWGDTHGLTPQQIADVMAYVMGLNHAVASGQ